MTPTTLLAYAYNFSSDKHITAAFVFYTAFVALTLAPAMLALRSY